MARTKTHMRLRGLKEMQATIQALPDAIQRPAVKVAQVRALAPMRDMAQELAPDAPPIGSGLKFNIITSDQLTPTQAKEDGGERMDESKVYMGVDGARPDYSPHGLLVEFGTGPRYHENGKYVGDMPAQPFIRPAFDATHVSVLQRFGRLLGPIVERAARMVRR